MNDKTEHKQIYSSITDTAKSPAAHDTIVYAMSNSVLAEHAQSPKKYVQRCFPLSFFIKACSEVDKIVTIYTQKQMDCGHD